MAQCYEGDISGAQKGRPLGFSEVKVYTLKDDYTLWYFNFIQTTQPLKDGDVITAGKILARKQESLQMCIVETHPEGENVTGLRFQPMKTPDVVDFEAVTVRDKDDWPIIIAQENEKKKFDFANGPLWRVILGRLEGTNRVSEDGAYKEAGQSGDGNDFRFEYLLFFKIHHVLCDGMSIIDYMLNQFMPILAAVVNGGDAERIIPFMPQAKQAEEFFFKGDQLVNPVSWFLKLQLDTFRFINRTFKSKPPPVLYKFTDDILPTYDDPGNEPRHMSKMTDKEVADSLILSAKRHGVSVHCVLLFASGLALCRTTKAAGVPLPKYFTQVWPISARRFTDYAKSPLPLSGIAGVGKAVHRRMTKCTLNEFWSYCRDLSYSVYTQNKKENIARFMALNKYITDSAKSSDFATVYQELGDVTIYFNNFGKIEGPSPEMTSGPTQIRITGIGGMINNTGENVPLCLFCGTYNGTFGWTLFRSKYTSRRFAETYCQQLENVLMEYCRQ